MDKNTKAGLVKAKPAFFMGQTCMKNKNFRENHRRQQLENFSNEEKQKLESIRTELEQAKKMSQRF